MEAKLLLESSILKNFRMEPSAEVSTVEIRFVYKKEPILFYNPEWILTWRSSQKEFDKLVRHEILHMLFALI